MVCAGRAGTQAADSRTPLPCLAKSKPQAAGWSRPRPSRADAHGSPLGWPPSNTQLPQRRFWSVLADHQAQARLLTHSSRPVCPAAWGPCRCPRTPHISICDKTQSHCVHPKGLCGSASVPEIPCSLPFKASCWHRHPSSLHNSLLSPRSQRKEITEVSLPFLPSLSSGSCSAIHAPGAYL